MIEKHKNILEEIESEQLKHGEFSTYLLNEKTGDKFLVHSLTATYLVCFLLIKIRDEYKIDDELINSMIRRGLKFLKDSVYMYIDPITNLHIWRFNAFYPPDWEDNAWIAYLLNKEGLIKKEELVSLKELAIKNDLHKNGVGVWIKDGYTKESVSGEQFDPIMPLFDPVVSLSTLHFMKEVFERSLKNTESFLNNCIEEGKKSLYYVENFQNIFYFLLKKTKEKPCLDNDNYKLYHHGAREYECYLSPAVWEVVKLYFDISKRTQLR